MEQWSDWKWSVVNYVCAQAAEYELELQALGNDRQADVEDLDAEVGRRSQMLFGLLVSTLTGRLLHIVRSVPRRNGYLAWRALLGEMEPVAVGRGLALLHGAHVGERLAQGGAELARPGEGV